MKWDMDRVRPLGVWVLGALPIAFLGVVMWQARWIGDDGLINIRVVNNILDGYGPVFNVGERVEVYTSPLWVFVLVLIGLLGIQPDVGSVYGGYLLSIIRSFL